MVVAERFNPRPSIFPLRVPERRDVSFVEVPRDVVENRGGASAFARGEDDLHEGTPEAAWPCWMQYIMVLTVVQGFVGTTK